MKQTRGLEIVWRNPNPPRRRQRWERIKEEAGTVHYLVQELVSSAAGAFWATTSSLELVHGACAA